MDVTGGTQEWLKRWTTHPRSLQLLRDWDSCRGLLLASHDESAEEAIPNVVQLLSPDYTVEVQPSFSKGQWREATAIISEKQIQQGLFAGPFPKRICLVMHHLHESPEWMLIHLQGLFELAPRPFCCVATTDHLEKIDGKYKSFFSEWRKIGRPRDRSQ